jgi:DNA-binding transcriptional ArsR family regulator
MAERNSPRWARVPSQIIADRSFKHDAKMVLLALCLYVDSAGVAFPSVATIAARVGISERSVQRHLRALAAAKYIEISKRFAMSGLGGMATNEYRVFYSTEIRALPTQASNVVPANSHNTTKVTKSPSREVTAYAVTLTSQEHLKRTRARKTTNSIVDNSQTVSALKKMPRREAARDFDREIVERTCELLRADPAEAWLWMMAISESDRADLIRKQETGMLTAADLGAFLRDQTLERAKVALG